MRRKGPNCLSEASFWTRRRLPRPFFCFVSALWVKENEVVLSINYSAQPLTLTPPKGRGLQYVVKILAQRTRLLACCPQRGTNRKLRNSVNLLWQSLSALTWPGGPGFLRWNKKPPHLENDARRGDRLYNQLIF